MIQRPAVLHGPYLYGKHVTVTLDDHVRITDSSAIHCVWSKTFRFDAWFRRNYEPEILVEELAPAA